MPKSKLYKEKPGELEEDEEKGENEEEDDEDVEQRKQFDVECLIARWSVT